jgi:hypothetical protein
LVAGTIGETVGCKTTNDSFGKMTLCLFIRVAVEQAIDTTSADGSSSDTFAFLA